MLPLDVQEDVTSLFDAKSECAVCDLVTGFRSERLLRRTLAACVFVR